MQVILNGQPYESFKPHGVIHPLSPYLFVLCMKRLSHLINAHISEGVWKPIKLSNNGPPLFELFFVNDLLLFAKVNIQRMNIILDCLSPFYQALGQKVNTTKTKILFSKIVGHYR